MKVTLIILGVVAALVLLMGGGWLYRYYTASLVGKVGAVEQIESAPSRITAYNHFFDLCVAVQGHEIALDAMTTQALTTTDTKELQRIQANIAGLTGQRGRDIAQYNGDARKSYTIAQFRDSDLPYQLPTASYGGDKTSCGSR